MSSSRILDDSSPQLFRQGLSAQIQLFLCVLVCALFLYADVRLGMTQKFRSSLIILQTPMSWLAQSPIMVGQSLDAWLTRQDNLTRERNQLIEANILKGQKLVELEHLRLENERLRRLLEMPLRTQLNGVVGNILYETQDPFAHRVVIDRGSIQGVTYGQPVIDDQGVVGQVVRVHPLTSEVVLLSDPKILVPVLDVETGLRGVVGGGSEKGTLELQFLAANAEVKIGHRLVTSGIDGVYPSGLPVGIIRDIVRNESNFAQILVKPASHLAAFTQVLVLRHIALPPPQEKKP